METVGGKRMIKDIIEKRIEVLENIEIHFDEHRIKQKQGLLELRYILTELSKMSCFNCIESEFFTTQVVEKKVMVKNFIVLSK